MKVLPLDIGILHFVGIGGIGMSGIAEVLHNLGYSVQGSDIAESANVKRLRSMGVNVAIGHAEENLGGAKVLVVSSAVGSNNPEVVAAGQRLMPVVRRAEMLAELMRLKWSIAVGGTHGKTTTTSMIAALLEEAALDPTVINGGIINALGSNARLGDGDWMVVEADESDGTFVKLPATIAVVTNIDSEHLDHYGTFDNLRAAFHRFVENIPFYGFAALCIDDAEVQAMIPRVSDRKIVTFGRSPQADVRMTRFDNVDDGSSFDVIISDRALSSKRHLTNLQLPMFGAHNVLNALAVIAVACEMGLSDEVIKRALAGFEGVKRRFTKTGEVGGISVIDDYGHHPVEIAAVMNAARAATPDGRIIAVFQPHRYTRLRDLFEDFCTCFNDADIVVVADVYAAGEPAIDGYDRTALVKGLQAHGHRQVKSLDAPEGLPDLIIGLAEAGDMVVCLGAGNVTAWASALPLELETRLRRAREARE
ncbi:MAG: UDP-N-acetylmuramate--L-alanine ligase [Rhodospirillaceae bacterium]|nr:UDP-N-acetylmuramate--L-alanine ligase [Rhodospirillaceae bacterium]